MLEKEVAKKLVKMRKTLSLAESCTGGLLANRLTNISGSSKFLRLGIIAYSNQAKIKLLKVSRKALLKYGAVSQPVAETMAQNVRKIFKTDFGIAITGIAGPTGATRYKPIGLTYIAINAKNKTICCKFIFKGNRTAVKSQAASRALRLLSSLI